MRMSGWAYANERKEYEMKKRDKKCSNVGYEFKKKYL